MSGPLLDRIDLHVQVPAVRWNDLEGGGEGEGSEAVGARVIEARARGAARLRSARATTGSAVRDAEGGRSGVAASVTATSGGVDPAAVPERALVNAELGPRELEAWCAPDEEGRALLRRAMERFGMSARGYHRTLRVARTVADLAGSEAVRSGHVAEALRYRGATGM